MGCGIDLIYHACQDIVDNNALIHDESHILHIFDEFLEELPEFKAHMEYTFKNKMSDYVVASKTKTVPIKDLIKDFFLSNKPV